LNAHLLTPQQRCDLELLLCEGFRPLTGFMGAEDYRSTLQQGRLRGGQLWPIPITLDLPERLAGQLSSGSELQLLRADRSPLAVLRVEEVFSADLQLEAQLIFGSADPEHPGVAGLLARNPWYVGGQVRPWSEATYEAARLADFAPEYRTPSELRPVLAPSPQVVAFQTRNPLHRAHLALIEAAGAAAGPEAVILLHPATGVTKPGDLAAPLRMRAYRAALRSREDLPVVLAALPLAMRMAGPKEALWHALIRKNFGATHFIVGRAHADPGRPEGGTWYPPFAAQELLRDRADELGIVPVLMPEFAYAPHQQRYVAVNSGSGKQSGKQQVTWSISGTELRQRLRAGQEIPGWFSPKEVIDVLKEAFPPAGQGGLVIWITGLPASGKSTLANALARRLEVQEQRAVSVLDSDVLREQLSSELGFSRADRERNVRRLGLVSSLIAKHRGIAIVAAISPYRQSRSEVRSATELSGGRFFEVYLATPLEVCRSRDPKGLYRRAASGELRGLTGMDDPYEIPQRPELSIGAAGESLAQAVERITSALAREDLIREGPPPLP
jgi:sulfate adenylyltransferase